MADRILIYAVTGSGKSTLAAALAERTGLPWHNVDELTFESDWVSVSKDEQRRRFEQICADDSWILDTAYTSWLDVAVARADLIVALDYPRVVSLGRLLYRTLERIVTRRPVCNGNVETWRTAFSRDSIVLWHCRTFARKRKLIRDWVGTPPVPRVLVLTSPRDTRAWLAALPVT